MFLFHLTLNRSSSPSCPSVDDAPGLSAFITAHLWLKTGTPMSEFPPFPLNSASRGQFRLLSEPDICSVCVLDYPSSPSVDELRPRTPNSAPRVPAPPHDLRAAACPPRWARLLHRRSRRPSADRLRAPRTPGPRTPDPAFSLRSARRSAVSLGVFSMFSRAQGGSLFSLNVQPPHDPNPAFRIPGPGPRTPDPGPRIHQPAR